MRIRWDVVPALAQSRSLRPCRRATIWTPCRFASNAKDAASERMRLALATMRFALDRTTRLRLGRDIPPSEPLQVRQRPPVTISEQMAEQYVRLARTDSTSAIVYDVNWILDGLDRLATDIDGIFNERIDFASTVNPVFDTLIAADAESISRCLFARE